ncbi:MAG: FtsQ-type POTRA domain-containing protein [Candidatus Omnitrophica bacterium]|nr:FtsQ-type POTRA domain-containing protein [Candidatus Omnitrophota bacterium]
MPKKSKKRWNKRRFQEILSQIIHSFGVGLFFISKFLPLLAIGILIGTMYHGIQTFLYADPYFRLDVIRVKTELPFSAKEIEHVSGLRLGENLLAIDLGKVKQRIERNPEIKKAEVRRVLPNAIEIHVIRRFEVFQVKMSPGGKYFAIDELGVILPKSGREPIAGLVLIEDKGVPPRVPGAGARYLSKNLSAFTSLYQYSRRESTLAGETIEKMVLDASGNFTIYLGGGLEIRLGKAYVKNLKKLQGLGYLFSSGERFKIEYLDLEYQDVIVKMKEDKRLKI